MQSICFIIAHKYYRQYPSYLDLYLTNIEKYYDDSFTIVVDNNSKYIDDIRPIIEKHSRVILLINDSQCKFEIGAYKCGIKYINDHDLINRYEYFVFAQDTFVLINKYDFTILRDNGIEACTVGSFYPDGLVPDVIYNVLNPIGLYNDMDKITFCWCCTFVLSKNKINDFLKLVSHVIINERRESCGAERYLARILYELNDHKNFDIDGDCRNLKYDCHTVDILNIDSNIAHYFVKHAQQKTEKTLD